MGAYVSTLEAPASQMPGQMEKNTNIPHSRQSSISSASSGSGNSFSSAERAMQSHVAGVQPSVSSSSSLLSSQTGPAHPMDPLSRTYPKPSEEVDLDEMLARKPGRWTLGHYIKETPVREPTDPLENKERVAQDMEAKKRELLAAKEEIRRLSIPK